MRCRRTASTICRAQGRAGQTTHFAHLECPKRTAKGCRRLRRERAKGFFPCRPLVTRRNRRNGGCSKRISPPAGHSVARAPWTGESHFEQTKQEGPLER